MKTLADLKRQAKNYTWENTFNSWFKNVGPLAGQKRIVSRVQTKDLCFWTKTTDGQIKESWLPWPKAKELNILPLDNGCYELTITKQEVNHVMKYLLEPIN